MRALAAVLFIAMAGDSQVSAKPAPDPPAKNTCGLLGDCNCTDPGQPRVFPGCSGGSCGIGGRGALVCAPAPGGVCEWGCAL
jgi:hypothetical protein